MLRKIIKVTLLLSMKYYRLRSKLQMSKKYSMKRSILSHNKLSKNIHNKHLINF